MNRMMYDDDGSGGVRRDPTKIDAHYYRYIIRDNTTYRPSGYDIVRISISVSA